MFIGVPVKIAALGSAAAALTLAGGLPAAAVTPTAVYVSAGSAAAGTTVGFSAASGAMAWKDASTGITFTCVSSNLSGGTLKTGAQGPNGTPVGTGLAQFPGTSSTAKFNTCKAVSNTISLTLAGASPSGLPWRMKADQTSTPAATGAPVSGQSTSVTVSNIRFMVTDGTQPSSCNFIVSGSVSGATLTNGNPSTLTIPAKTLSTSNLVISNFTLTNRAQNCWGGAFQGNGDKFSFSTTYQLRPTNSAQVPIWLNAT